MHPSISLRELFQSIINQSTHFAKCLICETLHLQWTAYQTILRSDDIETNHGPEHYTFKFCSLNLNSICAYDFTAVSLIKAYISVDSAVYLKKLDLTGYSFLKSNHPSNIKRGSVGLYVKDSVTANSQPDLVTLPECIVCEVQLDNKKHFFAILYRSPSQSQTEF